MNEVNPYEPPKEANEAEISSNRSAKSQSIYVRLRWALGGALVGSYFAFFPYLSAYHSAKSDGAPLDPSTANSFLQCCLLCAGAVAIVAFCVAWLYGDSRVIEGALAIAFIGHLLFAAFWICFGLYGQIGSHYVTSAAFTAAVVYSLSWYRQQMKKNQRKRPR